jgi:hypothetical protein
MSIQRYRVVNGNRPAQAQTCAVRRVRSGVHAMVCRNCDGEPGGGWQWPLFPVSGVRTKAAFPC